MAGEQTPSINALSYCNIKVWYDWGGYEHVMNCYDEYGNCLGGSSVFLKNDQAKEIEGGIVSGYCFDHREFTDGNGCCVCVEDNPISLQTNCGL